MSGTGRLRSAGLVRVSARPISPSSQTFVRASLDNAAFASILNYMVKYRDETLDRTFAALSDPTRRALLARLVEKESLSVSELAQPFPMSLPAIMKHLDVLSDA